MRIFVKRKSLSSRIILESILHKLLKEMFQMQQAFILEQNTSFLTENLLATASGILLIWKYWTLKKMRGQFSIYTTRTKWIYWVKFRSKWNCLSVFDHFLRLALKELNQPRSQHPASFHYEVGVKSFLTINTWQKTCKSWWKTLKLHIVDL